MLFVPRYKQHTPQMVLAAGGQPPLGLQDHLRKPGERRLTLE